MLPDPLKYWAVERESIRVRRTNGMAAPWTDDEILQTYRFCNVLRMHDRVSKWLLDHVLMRSGEWEPNEAWIAFTALCRWINWPPTIQAIMDAGLWPAKKLDYRAIARVMNAHAKDNKAWTGAYMIRPPSNRNRKKANKARFVVHEVVERGIEPVVHGLQSACRGGSVRGVWEILTSRLHWGSFMAGQLVADWTYTPLLRTAYDLTTWAPMGPGSIRGFNRIMGRPLKTPISWHEWETNLWEWRRELLTVLPIADMSAHDVQNCLCEVDKYLRVKNGEGRPRATYKPETAF